MKCTASVNSRVWLVDVLTALFAVGSWLCVHGLWVELPLLVQELPEGWNLPSYLSVVICISNLAPVTWSLLNHRWPRVVLEKRGIYGTIVIGLVSTGLIALFWRQTSVLWGRERSTTLLALVFFFGMVDCSSRVLYVPFMSTFQEKYLTSFFIGEGLSALIPAAIALVQGVGGVPECQLVNRTAVDGSVSHKYEAVTPPPLFAVQTFFWIILGVVALSAGAFHLLNYPSIVGGATSSVAADVGYKSAGILRKPGATVQMAELGHEKPNGYGGGGEKDRDAEVKEARPPNSNSPFVYAIIVQLIVCFISNGVLMSIQSFSSLPYGNSPFHLVVTLTTMINPLMCFTFFCLPKPTRFAINAACLLVIPATCYVMATAVLSPYPPLLGNPVGPPLIVAAWVFTIGLFVWIKVALATLLRGAEGKRGLFWFGASTQIGSATGGVFSFLLINFTDIFHSFNECDALNKT